MNYKTEFETWEERINAVSIEDIKSYNQPIDDYTVAAETLAKIAAEDKEKLAAAGLDVQLIDDIPSLSGALRYCQAQWMSEYRAKQDAQKEWTEKSPLAYELRSELLHHFSFAYRNTPDIKKKVMRIREGGGHADMIQDLIELAILGEKNPDELTKIGFDVASLANAKTTSHTMSELLANSNGSKDESSANKVLRDKAYTLLADRVSTIREYGRYVFWKDEDRKEKYLIN